VYVILHFFQKLLERTDGKNNKIFNFRTGENPEFTGFLSGANSQLYKKFRGFYSEHTLMDFTPETRILPEDNFSLKILSCFPQMTTI